MAMEICEVKTNKDRKLFLNVARQLYRDDKIWVCPLDSQVESIFDPEKNSSFKDGEAKRWYLKDKSGILIGRIAAFYNTKRVGINRQPTGGVGFFECIDELETYDLAIFGDVIEHFEKEKGHEVLKKLFEHTDNIIISTPNGFLPQGAWADNEREVHKSGWTIEDFKDYTVVEHKVVEDTLFKDIISSLPNVPEEMKKPVELLVLWIKKKA